ncbi:MAG: NAD(P)H-dependent oxidoreductase subunit E [Dethiobacter sp.]|jgi:NADH-quinone oxidoreductase subunit E|nr:MAG: NAD(P)H-dependent oxidoreductase subunit E [Dethiobacter sp.]
MEERTKTDLENLKKQNGSSVVSLLQEVQEKYNYLPEELLREIAKERNIPLMDIYSVATFYKAFSLSPKGKHKVVTCSGTACHVRGSEKVTREISRTLGIESGHTTEDGLYSLENVSCLGACALAPLVVIDGEYHGSMTSAKILEILNGHTAGKKENGCCCHDQGKKENDCRQVSLPRA